MVSTDALHAGARGSVPDVGGLKEAKKILLHPRVKLSIVGSLRDREVACSASDRQGSNLESCVWRTVSSQSSHHPQDVLLAKFCLYVHKDGLKPDSFPFGRHKFLEHLNNHQSTITITDEWSRNSINILDTKLGLYRPNLVSKTFIEFRLIILMDSNIFNFMTFIPNMPRVL